MLDFRTQTASEWIAELDVRGPRARDAAWSLWYLDDRSEPAVDALRRALANPVARNALFAIDSVLGAWGAEFDELPLEAFVHGSRVVRAEVCFAPPFEPLAGTPDELSRQLGDSDHELRWRAALTLVARESDVERALDVLAIARSSTAQPPSQWMDWLSGFAPRGFGAALGRVIAAERDQLARLAYDGRPRGHVALQRAHETRAAVYSGNVAALDELARTTRFVERDENYFLAVLERAPAASRAWALGLIELHGIDTPLVREGVRRRTRDVELSVARRAQDFLRWHGW